MEEFIFFAVIIFFSMVESMVRRRKAKQAASEEGEGEGAGALPPPTPERNWRTEHVGTARETLPTYDQDASYDDAVRAGARGGAMRPDRHRQGETVEGPQPGSEPVPSGDLLAELTNLAARMERAQTQARTVKVPRQSPPLPKRSAPSPFAQPGPRAGVPVRATPRPQILIQTEVMPTAPEHPIHLAHLGYGTDPSERAPSEQDGLDPLAEHLSAEVREIRAQLASNNVSELRKAVMLQEILGPPVALREGGL